MRKATLYAFLLLTGCGTNPTVRPTAVPTAVRVEAPQLRFESGGKESPVQLTASDGTGLEIVNYSSKAVLQGALAFTELHLEFANPTQREIEGRFQIRLPENAALSRFAVKTAEGWQEAEVVELKQAHEVYEDYLHRRQDPALLEKEAGNLFQARIFPIPASAHKELIVAYSEELALGHPYRMALAGLPKLGHFGFEAQVWTGPGQPPVRLISTFDQRGPQGDLVVDGPLWTRAVESQGLVLLPVRIPGESKPAPAEPTIIAVDTSASRALDSVRRKALLEKLASQLSGPVQLVAFDQAVVSLYEGPANGLAEGLAKLEKRENLGCTDFSALGEYLSEQKNYTRAVLVTDGVVSAGVDLKVRGAITRMDVLLAPGLRDRTALEPTVYRGLPRCGWILNPEDDLARLNQQPLASVKVEVSGAEWVWPAKFDGVAAGDERLVYARIPGLSGQSVGCKVGGEEQKLPVSSVQWPLLTRSATAADLGRLLLKWRETKGNGKDALAKEIVKLSCDSRVVCDLTAMLMLESDAEFERFGLKRNALADILVVGPQGLKLEHRQSVPRFMTVRAGDAKIRVPDDIDAGAEFSAGGPVPAATPAAREVRQIDTNRTDDFGERGFDLSGREESLRVSGNYAHNSPPAAAGSVPDQNYNSMVGSTGGEPLNPRPQNTYVPPRRGQNPLGPPLREFARYESSDGVPESRRRAYTGFTTSSANYPQYDAEQGLLDHPGPSPLPNDSNSLTGIMAEVDKLLIQGKAAEALEKARAWHRKEPGDVLALVALGRALAKSGQKSEALRAYASIIDLYPGRADLRRFAGCLLESVGPEGQALALDTFQKALERRPDHPSSHRLTAYALVRLGRLQEAYEVLDKSLKQEYPDGRFLDVTRILKEDRALVAAAWKAKGGKPEVPGAQGPSTRFVLTWETDANDVDFHILDARGGHAYYSSKSLASGGSLYADVTTGYGPECFTIPGTPQAGPYKLYAHYYSRGPMGYGMGKVEILRHDGRGGLTFEQRPFVVMNDSAYVKLGDAR